MSDAAKKRSIAALVTFLLISCAVLVLSHPARAADPCTVPIANPVACENTKAGNPRSEWDVSGSGSSSIQGFATQISVNLGETEQFKVKTPARSYRLDIYRMGYYAGNGARKIASITPSATLPQTQPNCLSNSTTGLVDCGNWGLSASWAIPSTAVSGVYFARLVRTDGTTGSSHVFFVVRDDSSHSDLLAQTSDTTWQAYNTYGGNSLYTGSPAGRAYKVSYNRPFTTRGTGAEDWVYNAEYPMVRFLEGNGYNISYQAGADTDRRGTLLHNHKTFLSVGHDEYWSGQQRTNVEAARDAGVNLAFFSGNESFWKTRWENSIDSSNTAYRTLVCYKETHANAVIDPQDPPTWTGTWRDPRFSPPADGGRPENAMTGTSFFVNAGSVALQVPAADGKLRFWRNSSVAGQAPGAVATLTNETVGYEWDVDPDNGARPQGLIDMSTTNATGVQVLQDYGSTYGTGNATHHVTLYRAAGGALVFGAGTVQWSWGLDSNHDRSSYPASTAMQQATVNLLADMGAQPATLLSGLTPATASSDTAAPTTTITSPTATTPIQVGTPITVSGTATDTLGVVGGVEVSVDGGATWHPATGRESWTYTWTPKATGSATIQARASDDSANRGTPASVTVTVGARTCPCSIWGGATPTVAADPDTTANELGVKFRADTAGQVTAIRFYKGTGNTGTHVGHLWTSTGTQLAAITFTGESASGWQQATLATPVNLTANTTYVVSYYAPSGHYAEDDGYFSASAYDAAPLHALKSGADGPNGVYTTGTGFPNQTFAAANYWVDVVFTPTNSGPDTTPPTVTTRSPAAGATGVATTTVVKATFSEPVQPSTVSMTVTGPGNTPVSGSAGYDSGSQTETFTPAAALSANTAYNVTVSGAKDLAGNTMSPDAWAFTTAAPSSCPCSLWASSATPVNPSEADPAAVELGVRFTSDVPGQVTGVRFYKGTGNTGTHIGHLWTSTGTLLGTVTFSSESASGWQQATFASPVTITAGTAYIVSYYAPSGRYAADAGYFTGQSVDRAPLHAPADSPTAPNGMYLYGTGGGFPTDTFQASNYWVDAVFNTTS
jgi:hypothetical protein